MYGIADVHIRSDAGVVKALFAKVQMTQQKKGKGRLKRFGANSTNMWLDGNEAHITCGQISDQKAQSWSNIIT
jgi:hypothetical protein